MTGIGGWKRKAGGIGFFYVQLFPAVRIGVEINLQCQERLNKLVIGWKVFVCILSHFCCSVVCFLQGYT